jgi:predicted anti-sigma-YlaC factor YlaD
VSAERIGCARARVLLEAYVDGDLAREDPELATTLREHLAICADCRRQHAHAASLPFRLKALAAPAPRHSLVSDVIRSVAPERTVLRRAWTLLVPEGALVAFILWYLSGLDGLASIASGIFGDLLSLGSGSVPRVPPVDAVLLVALIALTATAAYHLSILIRLAPAGALPSRRTARE